MPPICKLSSTHTIYGMIITFRQQLRLKEQIPQQVEHEDGKSKRKLSWAYLLH